MGPSMSVVFLGHSLGTRATPGEVLVRALMMYAASTSDTSVNFYQTARCNNPEDSRLHTCCCENLKLHLHSVVWMLWLLLSTWLVSIYQANGWNHVHYFMNIYRNQELITVLVMLDTSFLSRSQTNFCHHAHEIY
jgi:hypothetical protein